MCIRDRFIAVTEADELNIVSCALAKQYGVPQTIARIRNPEYVEIDRCISLSKLGVDMIINPERITALEIAKLLANPEFRDIEYFADGQIQICLLYTSRCV